MDDRDGHGQVNREDRSPAGASFQTDTRRVVAQNPMITSLNGRMGTCPRDPKSSPDRRTTEFALIRSPSETAVHESRTPRRSGRRSLGSF